MTRFDHEEEEAVLDVLRSEEGPSPYFKNPAGGKYVQELEKEFAEFVGADYAVAVSNGTTALHTAYLACGIRPADKVLVPAHTFIATASMVLAVGASPRFGDVAANSYCLSEEAMLYWGRDTRAMVPVDLLGFPMDLRPLFEEHGKTHLIIEDAAQAVGSYLPDKRHAGSQFNHCATWSAQFTKSWTAGEGGMVTTNDREIARRCRSIRSHGSGYLNDPHLTFNFRMSELHAAVGLVQLRKYPKVLEQHRENAQYLLDHLPKGLVKPYVAPFTSPNRYIIGCLAEEGFDRDGFVRKMTEAGVSKGLPGSVVSLGYTQPIYRKPLLAPYAPLETPGLLESRTCPAAEKLSKSWLWFDTHRFKSLDDVKADVSKMREAGY